MTDELAAVLEDSKALGFLGPGPVDEHVEHALAFVRELGTEAVDGAAVDLGSGGGLPGLVMALALPAVSWVLLDANQRRTEFLREAVARLQLTDRVSVRTDRAEVAGRDPVLRAGASLVVARSFSAPPVTAECAAPLLRRGGRLLVSEPPTEIDRWDAEALASLGMTVERRLAGPPRMVVIRQAQECADRFPRRTGVPGKRPLW